MKIRSFIPKSLFLSALILLNIFLGLKLIAKNNYTNNFFRIHIVANSDSPKDQIIKYEIAERLENYFINNPEYLNLASSINAKTQIEKDINQISNLVEEYITENNIEYSFKINIGNIYYEEKMKNNENMPEGIYPSIQILLGNSSGQNWWSLIYPKAIVKQEIKNEELKDTFNSSSNKIIFRSGFIQILKSLFN